jgi:acyl carrier protein|tara:strand:+ start:383 stop:622 length:240 start_codon:yes stop_codon:yes gene_type:complete
VNIIGKLLPIFQNVFDDDELIITSLTTAKDISGWDSLAHIRLIVAIEKSFRLRFSANEISELENVGEMVNLIVIKKKNV